MAPGGSSEPLRYPGYLGTGPGYRTEIPRQSHPQSFRDRSAAQKKLRSHNGAEPLVGLEASRRAFLNRPPGAIAAHLTATVLLLLVLTAASGLGMLVARVHPRQELHFMYAVLAFASIPIANALGSRASPRKRALLTAAGVLFGLVVIVRLFMTG
jgi:hypothetical protein